MKKNLLIFALLVICIFFALLYFDSRQQNARSSTETAIKGSDPSTQYPFLSKRIFAEHQNDILINFIPLRTAMREYVGKQKDQIGVYFEYLPSGSSIGVNDTWEVQGASLIKVPAIMGIYKQLEKGKLKKTDILTITEKDISKSFGNLWQKGSGTKITVDEAIRLSLVESDNTAATVLKSSLPVEAIGEVFDSLDIPIEKNVISPKNYSSILRSLYLSSYLKKEHSNEIIDILTKTNFIDKLPAGIPEGITVAHKIGVFKSENVFSDCGIIYQPNRPYLLCIITKGSENNAQKHMKHLSKMVYGYIAVVKGGQ